MNVGFVTFDRDRKEKTGSARIRAHNLIDYSGNEFEEFVVGKKYDAVVYQKNYWYDHAEVYQGIKILDICDPDWLAGQTTIEIVRFINLMTGIVANTDKMADYIKKLTDKPVTVIEDRHDMASMKQERIHKGEAKSVIWFGYSHNAKRLKDFIPALTKLGLKITIMSNEYVSLSDHGNEDFKDNENFVYWPDTIEKVNLEIIKHDICLLPTSKRWSEQYKSNNKTTHAWALGMPVANYTEDLERFMNEDERNMEKELRMAKTRKDYDCKISVNEYKAFIGNLRDVR